MFRLHHTQQNILNDKLTLVMINHSRFEIYCRSDFST